ncbi:protein-L-isoaspartate(D-aspartate) O-methyltransferase [Salinibaculum rarum]|uniref:protein-L-isoaspartate(D-aspartate) O-methyltransferase n=1 Tax=Salinibaculum rarum TaxID=3058903 RepID=UPI00265E8F70|nr:protein-L-isoaspartate(D-aspartate) O-methyltransferase [Salinibaculum sp. KK48]
MTDWTDRRAAMVDALATRDDLRERTLDAMRAVPRHEFVPEGKRQAAYEDTPLPIGEGQTISAPHMVAIMADLLELEPGDTVLEIGTGCGYHAAVTAEIVGAENVYSVEYHDRLATKARATLESVGYGAVSVRAGDGKEGWPDNAPYDRAYLTCAASTFPQALVDQVRPDGILLGPIGDQRQVLVRAWRRADGSLDRAEHGRVRFVPLQ